MTIAQETLATIFDIQSYSVHDGPGCRTTIFFKGCPLSCQWCANPESWRKSPEILFSPSKCKHNGGCKLCVSACPYNAISTINKELLLNKNLCYKCTTFQCAEVCYNEALRTCGKTYSSSELMKIINRDRQFWGEKGGVTFSGGEPFAQKDFLLSILQKCRDAYIHTTIETTAYTDSDSFVSTMKYVDFAFIDVKHIDREAHKNKTGVFNDLILKNITLLATSNWHGRLVLRMPVIKDFNDTKDHLLKIADFMDSLGLFEINLLPFHRLGTSKWTQLGGTYAYDSEEATSQEKMTYLQDILLNRDIACYIGHETSF